MGKWLFLRDFFQNELATLSQKMFISTKMQQTTQHFVFITELMWRHFGQNILPDKEKKKIYMIRHTRGLTLQVLVCNRIPSCHRRLFTNSSNFHSVSNYPIGQQKGLRWDKCWREKLPPWLISQGNLFHPKENDTTTASPTSSYIRHTVVLKHRIYKLYNT